MKTLVLMAVVAVAGAGFADKKPGSPEQVAEAKQKLESFLKMTGGILYNPQSGRGRVAVIDAQKAVPADAVKKHVGAVQQLLAMTVSYVVPTQKRVDVGNLDAELSSVTGNVSVVLMEDAPLSTPLISLPEKKCVIVNVGALSKDGPSAETLRSRLAKEISRAVCFAFGSSYSPAPGGIMDPVFSVKELDKILIENVQIAQKPYIERVAAKHFGITPFVRATYRDACQQGWAPKPANKYQEAVWNEVRAMPTAPLKIEK